MNDQQTEFVRIPGTGYLFLQSMHDDVKTKAEKKKAEQAPESMHRVALWEGHLTFPGTRGTVQVRAKVSSRSGMYDVSLHQYPKDESDPDAWKLLTSFQLPMLGLFAYTEGKVILDGRTMTIRLFKTGQNYLRLRLPQVMSAKAVDRAAM